MRRTIAGGVALVALTFGYHVATAEACTRPPTHCPSGSSYSGGYYRYRWCPPSTTTTTATPSTETTTPPPDSSTSSSTTRVTFPQ